MIEVTLKIKLTGNAEDKYRSFLRKYSLPETAEVVGMQMKKAIDLDFIEAANTLDTEGLSILVEDAQVTAPISKDLTDGV